jgi:hypothetical protein
LASHPRSKSKLTRTPWIVVILNSIVQSRSYPGPDPWEAALLALTPRARTYKIGPYQMRAVTLHVVSRIKRAWNSQLKCLLVGGTPEVGGGCDPSVGLKLLLWWPVRHQPLRSIRTRNRWRARPGTAPRRPYLPGSPNAALVYCLR